MHLCSNKSYCKCYKVDYSQNMINIQQINNSYYHLNNECDIYNCMYFIVYIDVNIYKLYNCNYNISIYRLGLSI